MSSKMLILLCLMCAVTAIPVPEEKPKSIELIQIPLKGDKVRFRAYTTIDFCCYC